MRNRSRSFALATATCGLALMTQLATERKAVACGGCFHEAPPPQNPEYGVTDITDERMLLSVSQTQTTLYDQIRYSGNPASFAWVLPIKGTVDVGLSADILFDAMDALTATQITGPLPPNCPQLYCGGYGDGDDEGGGGCGFGLGGSASDTSAGGDFNGSDEAEDGSTSSDGSSTPPVTVTKEDNVGPYETVQLHSSDPNALNAWLTKNGFVIPADVTPIIDAYVSEGFDFLAMRLLPNEGVQAMRPVRVTMPGASLSLPLRMAAIGTGATVGITIWVVAEGRYEPQNFPFFHIEDPQLTWDFQTQSSNYTTLRAQNEANLAGKGWEIESSIDLNAQTIATGITSGGASINGGLGEPSSADDDYLPITVSNDDAGASTSDDAGDDAGNDTGDDAGDAGAPDASVVESADDVRTQDINTLLEPATTSGIVRVTRIRSDISHAAMTSDFLLQASADQTQLTNARTVTNSTNVPVCPKCSTASASSASPSSSSGSSSGCACDTSGRPRNSTGMLLTFLGLFGLVFTRVIRVRRRR